MNPHIQLVDVNTLKTALNIKAMVKHISTTAIKIIKVFKFLQHNKTLNNLICFAHILLTTSKSENIFVSSHTDFRTQYTASGTHTTKKNMQYTDPLKYKRTPQTEILSIEMIFRIDALTLQFKLETNQKGTNKQNTSCNHWFCCVCYFFEYSVFKILNDAVNIICSQKNIHIIILHSGRSAHITLKKYIMSKYTP